MPTSLLALLTTLGSILRSRLDLQFESNAVVLSLCIGDFESTEEAFCCPDFTAWALSIDPPFAKLIWGFWFAKVVVMSERSTEQILELLDSFASLL
jgi:hypothetical protein